MGKETRPLVIIHFGSSEWVNEELRKEAGRINPEHAEVQFVSYQPDKPCEREGMKPICGCFAEHDGEVAEGYEEVRNLLDRFHMRRAHDLQMKQISGESRAPVFAH